MDTEGSNAHSIEVGQVGDHNIQYNIFDGTVHPLAHALAGILRVRIRTSGASFDVDGESVKVREVTSPGATLGRSKDTDLCVQGLGADTVSRLHLIMRPLGHRWTVTDPNTSNKTSEMAPDSSDTRPLPTNVAIPVENGMQLRLGRELWVGFEIEPAKFEGGVTPRLSDDPVRVRPPDLEEVALALLEPRRRDGAGARAPSVKELAGILHRSPAEIRRSLRELRALAHVKALERGPEHVAAALGRAFPYLQGID